MVICSIVAFIGLLYTYLAEGTGNQSTGHGALQAFQHGYNHWASGCLSHLELNYKHSLFCHVRCFMTPSMKSGVYHMYVLVAVEGEVCSIKKEMCCWVAMYYMFHLILNVILYLIAENLQPVHMFWVCSTLWCHWHLHSFR